MLKFYYSPKYKYTNRDIIDLTGDTNYVEKNYVNIDSPDTINGHIIYRLENAETIPTYVVDDDSGWKWFVSGITQLNSSKFQISLLRDVISEHPELWKNEQAYISSGLATDYNMYKRWDLPYTNTKIKQERFNFGGKSSFFVFYVNQQHYGSNITEDDLEIGGTYTGTPTPDITVSNLNEIPGFEYVGAGPLYSYFYPSSLYFNATLSDNNIECNGSKPSLMESMQWNIYTGTPAVASKYDLSKAMSTSSLTGNVNGCTSYLLNSMYTTASNYLNSLNTVGTSGTQLGPYLNKVIYDTNTNKYYKITQTNTVSNVGTLKINATYNASLINTLNNFASWPNTVPGYQPATMVGTDYLQIKNVSRRVYTYTISEYTTTSTFDFNFIKSVSKLPRSAVRCVNIVSDDHFSDNDIAQCLMLAQANAMNLGDDLTTGRILDIQYLPFSVADTTTSNLQINSIDLTAKFLEEDDYSFFTNLTDLTDINKETDTIKIVSPSRASQYLFRPYDNNGNMEFTTKVTLKPYTSTIYIRPSTQGLLITDWDDKDCLMIEEDFSLTQVNSEWANYVYNNRNYQNAFNRQIQGREFERSWEKRVEAAQMKSDEWTARNLSAQKTQTYTGNIPILSGIAGAASMLINGPDQDYMRAAATDRAYNQALYEEGISIARDNFQYQIDNIQSQPLIPSKVTTLDVKFLDGVYLEYYSTNPTELTAIDNFYKYNGNRIDCYGTFASYWGWFVRGKIIKSNNYTQPEIDEINRRLSMGIFTEVQYGN